MNEVQIKDLIMSQNELLFLSLGIIVQRNFNKLRTEKARRSDIVIILQNYIRYINFLLQVDFLKMHFVVFKIHSKLSIQSNI